MYNLVRIALVLAYIATMVWSFIFNLSPAINAYGFWPWMLTNIAVMILGAGLTFAFLTMSEPRKPQATIRGITFK